MKKIIAMIMVMCMIIGAGVMNVNALCTSEDNRPGIVGVEYIKTVMEIDERCDNGEFELKYTIEMACAEGYWVVALNGEADAYEDYSAFGIYDHMPTEEEINVLWANRMLKDELCELMEQYGI